MARAHARPGNGRGRAEVAGTRQTRLVNATVRGLLAAALVAGIGGGLVAVATAPGVAGATTSGTVLFSHTFAKSSLTSDGSGGTASGATAYGGVVKPSAPTTTNAACLTVPGATATSPIPSCATAPTSTGSGALRLTGATGTQEGGVFSTVSVPSGGGLDISYTSSQWGYTGGKGADGIGFVLAAVNPTRPLSPTSMGQPGGSLGYSANDTNSTHTYKPGLDNGYMGIGFDTYGNFINTKYQGTGCTNQSWESTGKTGNAQVTVRGPGNGTVGYCALNSTAVTDGGTAVALTGGTSGSRSSSNVPVEVVINTTSGAMTSKSGVTVAPGHYAVTFTPIGGAKTTLTGPLPSASGILPAAWLGTGGVPKQIAFGWVASTGGTNDNHTVGNLAVASINPVPLLQVTQEVYAYGTSNEPVTWVEHVSTGKGGGTEHHTVTVTDTVPAGVHPAAGGGKGWDCPAPVGQRFTCSYAPGTGIAPGTTLPPLSLDGWGTATYSATTLEHDNVSVVSSSDGDPSSSDTAPMGSPPAAPVVKSVSPVYEPLAGGNAATLSGTRLATATAVNINDAKGTVANLGPCASGQRTTCFTVTGSSLVIPSMPASIAGLHQLRVVTLGVIGRVFDEYVTPPAFTTGATVTKTVDDGQSFSDTPAVTGGIAPVTYSFSGLPTWATGTPSTGKVTGSTVTGGSTSYTVTATDAGGQTASQSVDLTVNGYPTFSPTLVTERWDVTTPGFSYSPSADLTGGTAPFTWRATGTLPTGLSVSPSTGVISGTPTLVTQTVVPVTVTDANGLEATQTVGITINNPPRETPSTTTLQEDAGHAFSHAPPLPTGGAGPFSWTSGPLPSGVGVSGTTGTLSGTVTTTGTYTVTEYVTDVAGNQATFTVTLVVSAPPSFVDGPSVSQALTSGESYDYAPALTAGVAPFTYHFTGLPSWATGTSSTGKVTGTVSGASGSYSVTATDATGTEAIQVVQFSVGVAPRFTPSSVTQSWDATAPGFSYSAASDLSGGTGTITWKVAGGSLPKGLSLDATTGTISGTPTVVETGSQATIAATDSNAVTAVQHVLFDIHNVPRMASKTVHVRGDIGALTYTPQPITGGTAPFTYSYGATLPLTFNNTTGDISGSSESTPGTYRAIELVTDAAGNHATAVLHITLAARPAFSAGPTVSQALTTGQRYAYTPALTGGTAPFSYQFSGLPSWAQGTATTGTVSTKASTTVPGTLIGTSGSYSLTATDAFGETTSQTVHYTVNGAPVFTPASVTERWDVTTPFTYAPSADLTGGTAPFTWKVASGTLPAGLSISTSTGAITGTPTATGTGTVKVAATDANGVVATQTVTFVISAKPSFSPPSATFHGDAGVAFSFVPPAPSHGTGPFTWTSGPLPGGIGVATATGELSGTISTVGIYTLTELVTDAAGNQTQLTVTIVVAAPPSFSAGATVAQKLTAGESDTYAPVETGGTAPITYSFTGLPTWASGTATTGTVTGTVGSASGSYTVTATDALGVAASQTVTYTVTAKPVLSPSSVPLAWDVNTAGFSYAPAKDLTGGTAPLRWTIVTGPLPGGLTFTLTTGSIGGTPATVGTSTTTVQVTDANGVSATQTLHFTINAVPTPGAPGTVATDVSTKLVYTPSTPIGGTGPFTWSSPDHWMTVNATTGAAMIFSAHPVPLTGEEVATDAAGNQVTEAVHVTINPLPTLPTAPGWHATFDAGQTIAFVPTVTGGTAPFTWAFRGLPKGLSGTATTGEVTGTVAGTLVGTSGSFTITVTDAVGKSVTKTGTYTVNASPVLAPTAVHLSWDVHRHGFSYQPSPVTGGTAPYVWSVTGTLAPGLALTATTGSITGTPTATGTFSFALVATDADGEIAGQTVTVVVHPAPSIGTGTGSPSSGISKAGVGSTFSYTPPAPTGGTGPWTWAATGLPKGYSVNPATGAITGRSSTAGTFEVVETATGRVGNTVSADLTIVLAAAPKVTAASTLPSGLAGNPYTATVAATGSTAPDTWAVTSGTLPEGLTLDGGTGAITGTAVVPGTYVFTVTVTDALGHSSSVQLTLLVTPSAMSSHSIAPTPDGKGYWMTTVTGTVDTFGNATFYGDMAGTVLNAPIVGIEAAPDGKGYWLVASDGGVFAFGSAAFYGSMGGEHLNQPVVGMAVTPDGKGYWEVARDGGVFTFGDAAFYGSMGGHPLNAPVVGMAVTPDGKGYWEVARDGGVFTFGDAAFYGSMGAKPLNQPVVGMAASPSGRGYWEVASDGGVFTFGDAAFYGSMGGTHLNQPVVSMVATPDGKGYWMDGGDGGVFTFGDAGFYGSTGGTTPPPHVP